MIFARYSEAVQKAAIAALDRAHRMGIMRVGNPWHPIADAIVAARDGSDRAVWLVELRGDVPRYWSIESANEEEPDGTFWPEAIQAVQFARKRDADAFIAVQGWTECFASEHIFVTPVSDTGGEK